jgi:chaperone required for assembly of F1-ATPase
MRDIFEEIFDQEPSDPMAAARRGMRAPLRKRFYSSVGVGEGSGGFAVLLDGKPVRTQARGSLAAPVRALADALAAEWDSQRTTINPAAMPLTRLANAVIDRVSEVPAPVRAEIERYLGSDLLFYRAPGPDGLLARQAAHWDPVLDWAGATFGARFVLAAGVTHVAQPTAAVAAVAAAIPSAGVTPRELWRLGALNVVTTLTGSALLALALAVGRLDAEAAWAAAHVDEDWNMDTWGRDALALERRAFHFAEMQAAALVLSLLR